MKTGKQELDRVLKQHKLWMDSDGKKGDPPPSFHDANFRGADLEGIKLYGTIFHRANFEGANLKNSNLKNCRFDGANFKNADLDGANLSGANFIGVDLTRAKFKINFRDVGWFYNVTVSKDQLCWLILHPRYTEWRSTLRIV